MKHTSTTTKNRLLNRRGFIATTGIATAAAVASASTALAKGKAEEKSSVKPKPGRLKHSVCHWCFKSMKLETLAAGAAKLGIKSIELVPPKDWNILKKHGLICAITSSHSFTEGYTSLKDHDKCTATLKKSIDATSDAKFPNVITFSGFNRGLDKQQGMKNMVAGMKKIVGYAEKKNVTICLEILNSRVDVKMKGHPGYMGDDTQWCIDVIKQVGSERFKLLFDVYHVQIMNGDVIHRIREYKQYIGHYHTAGNPGRNEIENDQELYYPAIMRAIADTKFAGYIGHEFIPTRSDKLKSLRKAVEICTV